MTIWLISLLLLIVVQPSVQEIKHYKRLTRLQKQRLNLQNESLRVWKQRLLHHSSNGNNDKLLNQQYQSPTKVVKITNQFNNEEPTPETAILVKKTAGGDGTMHPLQPQSGLKPYGPLNNDKNKDLSVMDKILLINKVIENGDVKLIEGDIILTDKFLNKIEKGVTGGVRRKKRKKKKKKTEKKNVMTNNHYDNGKWNTANIPYKIDNKLSDLGKKITNEAISTFNQYSCVKFRSRYDSEKDFVEFSHGKGCYSYVGRQKGKQIISLSFQCMEVGIILHQIFHTLGIVHTQSRKDRDQYVKVHYRNINKKLWNNFQKYRHAASDEPYDVSSIMHFGNYAFSENGQATVTSLTNQFLGQKNGLSSMDIAQLNKMYSCQQPQQEVDGDLGKTAENSPIYSGDMPISQDVNNNIVVPGMPPLPPKTTIQVMQSPTPPSPVVTQPSATLPTQQVIENSQPPPPPVGPTGNPAVTQQPTTEQPESESSQTPPGPTNNPDATQPLTTEQPESENGKPPNPPTQPGVTPTVNPTGTKSQSTSNSYTPTTRPLPTDATLIAASTTASRSSTRRGATPTQQTITVMPTRRAKATPTFRPLIKPPPPPVIVKPDDDNEEEDFDEDDINEIVIVKNDDDDDNKGNVQLLDNGVNNDDRTDSDDDLCKDLNTYCSYWKDMGFCKDNDNIYWMEINCPVSCGYCKY